MAIIILIPIVVLIMLIPIAFWRRRNAIPYEDERMNVTEIRIKYQNYWIWGMSGWEGNRGEQKEP
jgi:hypothetical protein